MYKRIELNYLESQNLWFLLRQSCTELNAGFFSREKKRSILYAAKNVAIKSTWFSALAEILFSSETSWKQKVNQTAALHIAKYVGTKSTRFSALAGILFCTSEH